MPEPSSEDRAIVIETLCRVGAMLERLPEKVATAFVLSQLHGMRYGEIAARLGVSERMVKKYMARAMLSCVLLEAESRS
jgi:RNA polymerase sigma-70 factor (ECF subfamily)